MTATNRLERSAPLSTHVVLHTHTHTQRTFCCVRGRGRRQTLAFPSNAEREREKRAYCYGNMEQARSAAAAFFFVRGRLTQNPINCEWCLNTAPDLTARRAAHNRNSPPPPPTTPPLDTFPSHARPVEQYTNYKASRRGVKESEYLILIQVNYYFKLKNSGITSVTRNRIGNRWPL